jgi:hypothetical protein
MEITLSSEKLDPTRGLPSKRFGLFTVGADGLPETLQGRYDGYYDLIARRNANPAAKYLVEVAHYAFLSVEDFATLFGPIPQALNQQSWTRAE